jgi:7-cyano-7-deazaguanine synthase
MASGHQTQVTVLLSGGVDSIACAHFLQRRGLIVRGLFIDYGQAAARREAVASAALAEQLAIPLQDCTLLNARRRGAGELLGRNAMLIFSALFLTQGVSDLLALGVHAGLRYFDCSEAFIASADRLVGELTDRRVSLVAPFIAWSKKDVFDYFMSAGLPLALTYSCENGTDPVCGECASCRDRKAMLC